MNSSEIIRIYDVKSEFLERAKMKYKTLAAYKLAESYTAYGEEILCDIITIILLAFAFQYGMEMKLHGRGTAVIATSIFLLMNLSEVLKSIVKLTVNLETFFTINMVPDLRCRNPSWSSRCRVPQIWTLLATPTLKLSQAISSTPTLTTSSSRT